MFRQRKTVLSFGAVALAAIVLILSPKAAHAVAATLVQVTNTASSPAIAQSPNTQAAQLVQLTSYYTDPGAYTSLQLNALNNHFTQQVYTVPANQSLVITAVDITPLSTSCTTPTAVQLYGVAARTWSIASQATVHFEYPSGIVIGPGITPAAVVPSNNQGCGVVMDVTGYLTSN